MRTRNITCENGEKIKLAILKDGYKTPNGVFIKKIRVTTQWYCNFRRSAQYTRSWKWGYSKNEKRIDNDTCSLDDTLKSAVTYATGNYE